MQCSLFSCYTGYGAYGVYKTTHTCTTCNMYIPMLYVSSKVCHSYSPYIFFLLHLSFSPFTLSDTLGLLVDIGTVGSFLPLPAVLLLSPIVVDESSVATDAEVA